MNDRNTTHPSDYALLEALSARPNAERLAPVVRHLTGCADCRARLEAMRAERAQFLAETPPAVFAAALDERERARVQTRVRPRAAWTLAALGGAAALAALVAVLPLGGPGPAPTRGPKALDGPSVRMKGSAYHWVALRDGAQLAAPPDFAFAAGDRIGVAVTASQPTHAAVLAVDASGAVTLLHPSSGAPYPQLSPGQRTTLPLSVGLTPPLEETALVVVLLDPVALPSPAALTTAIDAALGGHDLSAAGNLQPADLPGAIDMDVRRIRP